MRIAVLAASSYAACQRLPEVSGATLNLDVLAQRLSESDAGYTVHAFRAERGLAEALEQVLANAPEPVEALLFYFSGYAVVSDERGPALLLDGERLASLSFKRLRRVLDERARSAFLVLDTLSAFDAVTPPEEAARLLATALEPGSTPVHCLVANRPEATAGERSPFTSLLELVLDWQTTRTEPLGAEELVSLLRAEEALFSALKALEYVPASEPFAVLVGTRPTSLYPEAPPLEPVPDQTRVSAEERSRALEASVNAEVEGDLVKALEQARVAVRGDPRDVSTLEWTLELLERSSKPDGVYNALSALELAGGAGESQRAVVLAHRPEGLLAAQGVVTEGDWLANLLCPERETTTEQIVRALGDGAVELGLETAQRKRRAVTLDPAAEQDPEKSTTTLARTLVWSARVLGLPRPKLHVRDAVPGELAVADVKSPTVLASKALGSGLTLPELVFRWARALVYLRPELRLLAHFSGPGELEALGRAAVALVASGGTPRLDGDAKLLLRGLRRHLHGPVLARLRDAIGPSSAADVSARLRLWARSAELLAGRAGLLACGNLELAAKVSERAPLGSISAADQIADLVAYSLGDEYSALRTRLGVAVTALGTPEPPPARSAG
ncbi:MAG TPA: hypothetical protein VFV94_21450 [Polyangiaceae bacterium]|nr:hypothetical protein [Polyangiaceae bacterium]